jgi:hypothetical protein
VSRTSAAQSATPCPMAFLCFDELVKAASPYLNALLARRKQRHRYHAALFYLRHTGYPKMVAHDFRIRSGTSRPRALATACSARRAAFHHFPTCWGKAAGAKCTTMDLRRRVLCNDSTVFTRDILDKLQNIMFPHSARRDHVTAISSRNRGSIRPLLAQASDYRGRIFEPRVFELFKAKWALESMRIRPTEPRCCWRHSRAESTDRLYGKAYPRVIRRRAEQRRQPSYRWRGRRNLHQHANGKPVGMFQVIIRMKSSPAQPGTRAVSYRRYRVQDGKGISGSGRARTT